MTSEYERYVALDSANRAGEDDRVLRPAYQVHRHAPTSEEQARGQIVYRPDGTYKVVRRPEKNPERSARERQAMAIEVRRKAQEAADVACNAHRHAPTPEEQARGAIVYRPDGSYVVVDRPEVDPVRSARERTLMAAEVRRQAQEAALLSASGLRVTS